MCMYDFYNFLDENSNYKNTFENLNENMQENIINVIQGSEVQTNAEQYFAAIVDAVKYPNALKDLRLQTATDGFEARNVVNEFDAQYRVTAKMSEQMDILEGYIANCRHEDLKQNFSLIPEGEKCAVLQKAVIEFKGNINSTQLRNFMYQEAVDYTEKQARQLDAISVNIKTSHAERLDR